jgi:hypothetical protein
MVPAQCEAHAAGTHTEPLAWLLAGALLLWLLGLCQGVCLAACCQLRRSSPPKPAVSDKCVMGPVAYASESLAAPRADGRYQPLPAHRWGAW